MFIKVKRCHNPFSLGKLRLRNYKLIFLRKVVFMSRRNVILFDLDGTLIDSTEAIVGTFYHTFEKLDFPFKGDDNTIKSEIGYPLDVMYEKLGVQRANVWDFVDAYKQRYRVISKEQTSLIDDAIKSLELASSFAELGIVTTKTRLYTTPLLDHLNISKYFKVVTGREDVTNPKPHSEPINLTLNLMKDIDINKDNIWMIGDTKLDLISARSAQINSVGVLCGYGEKEELLQHSNYVVDSTFEAVSLIKDLMVMIK